MESNNLKNEQQCSIRPLSSSFIRIPAPCLKFEGLDDIEFALGAVADFGAKNFQSTTKADARHDVELTTKTAIEPNACYSQCFFETKY